MRFADVAGAPGTGKSTLCYPVWQDKSVGWDGKNPPAYWKMFLEEVTNLMVLIQDHPSFEAVLRMNDRSAKKMATVERMDDPRTFVQTGWMQRILGFGWRLHEMKRDTNLIRPALWRMPVSVGVAFLEADLETILQRNRNREKNPATAHENRSHQVPHMLAVIPIAKEVMHERGVAVASIDVQHQSIDDARAQLLEFSAGPTCHAPQVRHSHQVEAVSAPRWFRRS